VAGLHRKLELVREEKLYRLIPGLKKRARLEASGVALIDDATALVVFDNRHQVARIDLSLEPSRANRLLPAPGPGSGFEDIAVDREGGRVFCLVEALEDVDGRFRGFVSEYSTAHRFVRCTGLDTVFERANKGFEGLAHVRREGREYLYALCEGNLGTSARRGGGRIDAFTRTKDGGWKPAHRLRLPKSAEFSDYAALAYQDGRVAVVSQTSARVWTARLDPRTLALVPRSEAVYRFPKKSYGNVEGIAWLTADTLVAVSDRRKADQPRRCARRDQSIHLFRIPDRPRKTARPPREGRG
jgi:hypothetical protein